VVYEIRPLPRIITNRGPGLDLVEAKEWFGKVDKQIYAVLRELVSLVEGGLLEEEAGLGTELLSRFNATSLNEAADAAIWESDRNLAAFFAGTYITALSTAVMAELLRRTNMPLEHIEDLDGISHQMAASLFGRYMDASLISRRFSSAGGWPPHVFELPQRLASVFHER